VDNHRNEVVPTIEKRFFNEESSHATRVLIRLQESKRF
jgi:hypothetical protein